MYSTVHTPTLRYVPTLGVARAKLIDQERISSKLHGKKTQLQQHRNYLYSPYLKLDHYFIDSNRIYSSYVQGQVK